nr:uncharacterized protein LOC128680457 [Plodia interpunctella]
MCRFGKKKLCPPDWEWEALPDTYQPVVRTPLDKFGFAMKCCYCIPLRPASIFVCIISIIWSCVQMYTGHKLMRRIFENPTVLYWSTALYTLIALMMMISSIVLLLGIIKRNYKFLNFYVWFALIYIIIYITIVMLGAASTVAASGYISLKKTLRLLLTMLWTLLFLYFIMIVNSYRITVWAY